MMIFAPETKTIFKNRLSDLRKIGLVLNIAILLAMTLHSQDALANKMKLAAFPVNNTMDLSKSQRDYLYDVIREAASASAGSYIALIHEQKIKQAIKKSKNGCNEECALKAATAVDARVALVVEMHEHGTQILGVVKLLDTKENVLLTVKRFFSDTLAAAEQELQGAVMFVLSAQFLPIEDHQRRALQTEQQNIPVNYARPNENDRPLNQPTSVNTLPPAPNNANNDPAVPDYSYSNTDIAQPSEPRSPKQYLIIGSVTGGIGLGLIVVGVVFGVSAAQEQDNYNTTKDMRATLVNDYNNMDSDEFLFKYRDQLKLDEPIEEEVERIYNVHTHNLNIINTTVKQNAILGGVFGGIGLASAIVGAVHLVKFAKARKAEKLNANLQFTPVLTPKMSGAFLSGTF